MTEEEIEEAEGRLPGGGVTDPPEPELTGRAARFAACMFEQEESARINDCPGDQVAYCEGEGPCTCRPATEGEGSPIHDNAACNAMMIDCSEPGNQNSPCCQQ